jgi:two-component system, NtrC family, response regulator AtoC
LTRETLITESRSVLDPSPFRQRLSEEVERAVRYQRFVSLLYVDLGKITRDAVDALYRTAADALRVVDIVGRLSDSNLVVILPETGANAEIPATRLLEKIHSVYPNVKAGLSKCPCNGMEAETLIESARNAAAAAESGALVALPDLVTTISIADGEPAIIAADPVIKQLFALVRKLARSHLSILITGETGVGKEIVAQAIHRWSDRKAYPLLCVNCAAIPESLLENELFGHERGAFSGADTLKPGLIESASGGTLFLDEISEAPPSIQAGLLRVLETRRTRRVGATREKRVDVRFIAATNRQLDKALQEGRFRSDLYFRLSAARIAIPALRKRPADIMPLAELFLNMSRKELDKPEMFFSEAAREALTTHVWPGNVRELKNLMGFLSATLCGPVVDVDDLLGVLDTSDTIAEAVHTDPPKKMPGFSTPPPVRFSSGIYFRKLSDEIKDLEKQRIEEALIAARGVRKDAAALIGMPLRTLVTKIKVYGLSRVGMSEQPTAKPN